MILALLLIGCGLIDTNKPHGRVEIEVHRGDGYALQVPVDAVVAKQGPMLRVDDPQGRFWFDVMWVANAPSPRIPATQWANSLCQPIRWDAPTEPTPDTWTAGGMCTIGGHRRHWVFTVVERHGDRSLLLGLVAPLGPMAWEDTFVQVVRTAATLQVGDTPLDLPDEGEIRRRVRELKPSEAAGSLPIPGGGTFSATVSQAFTDVWEARLAAPAPPQL